MLFALVFIIISFFVGGGNGICRCGNSRDGEKQLMCDAQVSLAYYKICPLATKMTLLDMDDPAFDERPFLSWMPNLKKIDASLEVDVCTRFCKNSVIGKVQLTGNCVCTNHAPAAPQPPPPPQVPPQARPFFPQAPPPLPPASIPVVVVQPVPAPVVPPLPPAIVFAPPPPQQQPAPPVYPPPPIPPPQQLPPPPVIQFRPAVPPPPIYYPAPIAQVQPPAAIYHPAPPAAPRPPARPPQQAPPAPPVYQPAPEPQQQLPPTPLAPPQQPPPSQQAPAPSFYPAPPPPPVRAPVQLRRPPISASAPAPDQSPYHVFNVPAPRPQQRPIAPETSPPRIESNRPLEAPTRQLQAPSGSSQGGRRWEEAPQPRLPPYHHQPAPAPNVEQYQPPLAAAPRWAPSNLYWPPYQPQEPAPYQPYIPQPSYPYYIPPPPPPPPPYVPRNVFDRIAPQPQTPPPTTTSSSASTPTTTTTTTTPTTTPVPTTPSTTTTTTTTTKKTRRPTTTTSTTITSTTSRPTTKASRRLSALVLTGDGLDGGVEDKVLLPAPTRLAVNQYTIPCSLDPPQPWFALRCIYVIDNEEAFILVNAGFRFPLAPCADDGVESKKKSPVGETTSGASDIQQEQKNVTAASDTIVLWWRTDEVIFSLVGVSSFLVVTLLITSICLCCRLRKVRTALATSERRWNRRTERIERRPNIITPELGSQLNFSSSAAPSTSTATTTNQQRPLVDLYGIQNRSYRGIGGGVASFSAGNSLTPTRVSSIMTSDLLH